MYNFGTILNMLDWDAPSYTYTRATQDSKPWQMVKEDKKTTIVFNALGIKKEDIKIDVIQEGHSEYLTISGETKNEQLNKTYSVNGRFGIDSAEIDNISWDVKDGLLNIEIAFKEPTKPKVKINCK